MCDRHHQRLPLVMYATQGFNQRCQGPKKRSAAVSLRRSIVTTIDVYRAGCGSSRVSLNRNSGWFCLELVQHSSAQSQKNEQYANTTLFVSARLLPNSIAAKVVSCPIPCMYNTVAAPYPKAPHVVSERCWQRFRPSEDRRNAIRISIYTKDLFRVSRKCILQAAAFYSS